MNTNQYDWVDFYKDFSYILLAYKNNRQELIDKVKSIYSGTGINLPTLEKDNQIVDIVSIPVDQDRVSGVCKTPQSGVIKTVESDRMGTA